MRLMLHFARTYPRHTLSMLFALLLAGVVEGLSLTALLPMLNIAVSGGGKGGSTRLWYWKNSHICAAVFWYHTNGGLFTDGGSGRHTPEKAPSCCWQIARWAIRLPMSQLIYDFRYCVLCWAPVGNII